MRSELGDKVRLQHILDAIIEKLCFGCRIFSFPAKLNDAFCMHKANGDYWRSK